jgi:hypothetical protein
MGVGCSKSTVLSVESLHIIKIHNSDLILVKTILYNFISSQNAFPLWAKISFDISYIGHKYHEGFNFLRVSPGPFLLSVKRWGKLLICLCPPLWVAGYITRFLT